MWHNSVTFFVSFFSEVGKSARLEAAGLDTLTAPTLEPEPSEPEDEPKLTIITPSSVVVMSTPASRPTTNTPSTQLPWVCCQNKPRVKSSQLGKIHKGLLCPISVWTINSQNTKDTNVVLSFFQGPKRERQPLVLRGVCQIFIIQSRRGSSWSSLHVLGRGHLVEPQ